MNKVLKQCNSVKLSATLWLMELIYKQHYMEYQRIKKRIKRRFLIRWKIDYVKTSIIIISGMLHATSQLFVLLNYEADC